MIPAILGYRYCHCTGKLWQTPHGNCTPLMVKASNWRACHLLKSSLFGVKRCVSCPCSFEKTHHAVNVCHIPKEAEQCRTTATALPLRCSIEEYDVEVFPQPRTFLRHVLPHAKGLVALVLDKYFYCHFHPSSSKVLLHLPSRHSTKLHGAWWASDCSCNHFF